MLVGGIIGTIVIGLRELPSNGYTIAICTDSGPSDFRCAATLLETKNRNNIVLFVNICSL